VSPTASAASNPEPDSPVEDAQQFGVRRFFRNAGIIALAETFARLKGLVILPLLTHRLGSLNYGVWSQVLLIVTFVPLLMMLGTDSAVVRFLPGMPPAAQRRHFAGWLVTMLGLAAFLGALLWLARGFVANAFFGGGADYERFIPLAAANVWVTVLITGLRNWFRVRNDAVFYSSVTVGQAVLSLVATVVMLVEHKGVYTLVVYLLLADLTLAALLSIVIARRDGIARPDFSLMAKFVRFGLPLVPAGFAVWGLNWIDRLFMVQYSTLRDIGVYSLAYGLGYMGIQVIANPIYAMFPTAASAEWDRGRRHAVQELFERTGGATLFLMTPLIAGTIALGPRIIAFLAPPSFHAAAAVMPIVMAGYLLMMLAAYYEITFGLVERQWLSSAAVGVALVVNIPLNFLLIPPYSLYGAAIATTAAFAAQLVFVLAVTARLGTLRTPVTPIVRMVLAAAGMGAGVWAASELLGMHDLLGLAVLVVFGVALYLLLAVVLRAAPRELTPHSIAELRGILLGPSSAVVDDGGPAPA